MSLSIACYAIESDKHSDEWKGTSSHSLHDLYYNKTGDTLRRYLPQEEFQLLEPVDWPEEGRELEYSKDPRQLKAVIEHLSSILQSRSSEFPMAHMIVAGETFPTPSFDAAARASDKPGALIGTGSWKDNEGRTWSVFGMHKSVERRDELHVHIRNGDKEDYWIEAKELVEIDGKTIRVVTRSWYEYLQRDIESAIGICDRAVELNTRVLWAM